ncbi:Methenyltetrahydromethanopterin cyclohydrolase [Anatilimnocola aggregata]|uniref:Methenyltetrahydromethanopterin cyclohydrolase n=1 Tax=Anatilimnocola aggregata TaxID=2528021 RepID=A0A517Y5C0_9BACT|nr:methenyltetrahydromethanopterin cyclohydrolase [Anatilimnocola aggregata]QDU25444.1 Methenyltetrahydromethanopterin cyclohydrolase [Anatilimnocola aggregata]
MPVASLSLNDRAWQRADLLAAEPLRYNLHVARLPGGARLIDCGVQVAGGLEAGRQLAEICLSGLGTVSIVPGERQLWAGPAVTVHTDQPVAACLASQYAGWQVTCEKYFAMGSGPMRAAANREPLFKDIGNTEAPQQVVGILETNQLPTAAITGQIAEACRVAPDKVTLLCAPTASLAGTMQVVARSLETALHKLHELKFDLTKIVSGFGVAPLPPIAKDDLDAIGRTNDAILYGGEVTIWVRASDDELATLGPQVPSSSSRDFGEPFGKIFERYSGDFYKIDPFLFSPAVINFVNLTSGKLHRFGQFRPDVLQQWLT